jgi:hypothetical protein
VAKLLLDSLSWNAEKLLKRRKGAFDLVLAIFERPDGARTSLEFVCRASKSAGVSDQELLSELGVEIANEAATRGAVKVGVAFYGSKVKEITRTVPPIETVSIAMPGVVLEIHSADLHQQAFRELIERPGGTTLAAMTEPISIHEGPYMAVLKHVPQAMAAE